MADFGSLRSLLQRPPSTTLWNELCDIVDDTPSPQLEAQFLPYIHGHLKRWPEDIKQMAPMAWVEDLFKGKAPAKLSLCSNLYVDGDQPESAFEHLVDSPYFGGLEHLRISDWEIQSQNLALLATQLHVPSLTQLALNRCGLKDQGLAILCEDNIWLDQLTSLSLWGNDLTCTGINYLRGSLKTNNLTKLSFWDNNISTEGLTALAETPLLANIRHLDLDNNDIPDEGFMALARSSFMKNIDVLYAFENQMTALGFRAICQSPNFKAMTRLNVRFNQIGDEGIEYLADSELLGSLIELNIADTAIGNEAIKLLVNSPHFEGVETLIAWDNEIDDEGALAIANSPYVHTLKLLDLDINEITSEGRARLANSPNLSEAVRLRFEAST